jgi:hypothetical protein
MKKIILLCAAVAFSASSLFISCTSEDPQVSLQDQILNDQAFEDATIATMDFIITAVSHNWLDNMARINTIIADRPVGSLSEAELAQISDLLGMELEDYLRQIETFASGVNTLYAEYPQLAEMSQVERNELFAGVLSNSPAVADYVSAMQEDARGPFDWIFCALQDACYSGIDWLVPTVQYYLGLACDFVSGIEFPIPFLDTAEEFICVTAPGYVEAYLPGICGYIPCEP